MDVGFGFFVKWALLAIVGGVAAMILFLVFGAAWAAWGALATFVVIGGVVLLIGWLYDRRQVARYEELGD
jgi:1,4-dihydroxy-2-naphthoate octaprenyltransferase